VLPTACHCCVALLQCSRQMWRTWRGCALSSFQFGTPLPLPSSFASWQVPLRPSAPNRFKPSNGVKHLNLMRRQLSCDFSPSNCDAPQCLKRKDCKLFLAPVVLFVSAPPASIHASAVGARLLILAVACSISYYSGTSSAYSHLTLKLMTAPLPPSCLPFTPAPLPVCVVCWRVGRGGRFSGGVRNGVGWCVGCAGTSFASSRLMMTARAFSLAKCLSDSCNMMQDVTVVRTARLTPWCHVTDVKVQKM
jgi:hypothetical protein